MNKFSESALDVRLTNHKNDDKNEEERHYIESSD